MSPKYPEVNVQLVGQDGNAYSILGRVQSAMRQAGIDQAERDAFREEATAGDYNHLLSTVMKWVNIDAEDEEDLDLDLDDRWGMIDDQDGEDEWTNDGEEDDNDN